MGPGVVAIFSQVKSMNEKTRFGEMLAESVRAFPENRMCRAVDGGELTMAHYHALLRMIFHQTFQGPSTFAFAGAHVPLKYFRARDYLLHHADEEKSHWEWVINDLRKTGFDGADPRDGFPPLACQAYIAFNFYVAMKFPLGRLGIAAVLESIGANYGKTYATKLITRLQLRPDQAVFLFGHGDTDVGHSKEILEVLDECDLPEEDWRSLTHCGRTAGIMYRDMYDQVLDLL